MPNFVSHFRSSRRRMEADSSPDMESRLQPVWLYGILLLAALVALVTSCALKPKSTLVVGMELNYPPFEMVDPQGKPVGISVEMANEVGNVLTKDVQIQKMPFEGLIPALKTGKIDLIISSVTETPERGKAI